MANKRVNKLVAKKNRQPEVNGVPIDWDDTLLKNYPKVKDMRGQVFGELVVRKFIGVAGAGHSSRTKWLCRCSCGTDREYLSLYLPRQKHCGCKQGVAVTQPTPPTPLAVVAPHPPVPAPAAMLPPPPPPPPPPTPVPAPPPAIDPVMLFARNSLLAYACMQWHGYQPAAHHRLIAKYLEKVERREIKRLIISLPPRHGKSQIVSEYFPAWFLGRNPDKSVIGASYGQELASDFGRKVRNQIGDPLFSKVFPGVSMAEDSAAVDKFNLCSPYRGGYFAVGVGGAIVGRGAHLLLIDDPLRNHEDADSESHRRKLKDWYTSAAYTRLMDNGAIVLIMQRWHIDDLAGWLLKEHKHEKWVLLNLPAINRKGEALWPERYPIPILNNIKATLPRRDWEALYQQKPFIEEGGIFKRQWWNKWPDHKSLPECSFILQSWDTATTDKDLKSNSYSARTTWGVFKRADDAVPNVILLDRWKERVEFPELEKEAMRAYQDYQPDKVIIEKKSSGQQLIQILRRMGLPLVEFLPEKIGDKTARAYAAQFMFENGRVYYPDRRWAEEVIDDLAQFSPSSPNDITDTVTMAIIWLQKSWFLQHSEMKEVSEEEDDDLPNHNRRLRLIKKRAAYG